MIKQKNIFGIAILLILIVNFSFILAQEIEIKNEIVTFDTGKVDYTISEDGKEIKLKFTDGGFAEIKGIRFENILPADKSLNPSYIKMDNLGNIFEADLTANEKGSSFLINGINFEAPPNSRVYYDKDGFYLENIRVYEIEKDKFVENQIFEGKNVNLFDEVAFDYGKVIFNKDKYMVEYGEINYENMKVYSEPGFLITRSPLIDLSEYKGNFIQKTNNGLNIQSVKESEIELTFLEENEFFSIHVQKGNEEHNLFMSVYGGDRLEITKKDSFIKGMPPSIRHKSFGQGQTIIENGRHIFKFENGKYLSELENLNTKNKLSTEFNLDSNILKEKSIKIDDENGYSIYEPKTGKNIFTFDKTLLAPPNHDFKSEIGKKMYSLAENQVGDSAFVWGGRGNVFYDEEKGKGKVPDCGVKGYDCIGLPLTFLPKIYPENSLKDFPPNLKLVETLEKKGWNSYVIEPSEVAGQRITEISVEDITPGSIVFLMHPYYSKEFVLKKYGLENEGISYKKYLNSEKEEVFLDLGHTLIRGTGLTNFINAKPNVPEEELPKLAREYNEYLKKQGKKPFFVGTVKEGEMVPENDYLIVISPPKT